MSTALSCLLTVYFLLLNQRHITGQTEGDIGYDYNGSYDDDDYDEEDAILGFQPTFDVPVVNVTVVAGQTAVLPCSIDYLGKNKVAWLDHKSMPLTLELERVVDDVRFTIVRQDGREWNLQLIQVKPQDHGEYRCTVNTNPVRSKVIKLHVQVPATINVLLSSSDVTVVEGESVSLVCNVSGTPKPDVTWFRRPTLGKTVQRQSLNTAGEVLTLKNITRQDDDIYECVANNGVRPSASHQIRLTVHFAPEIYLRNRRIGQALGRDTILECVVKASPHQPPLYYWEKDGQRFPTDKERHHLEAFDEADNSLVLSLRINYLQPSDYGMYNCHASNLLGAAQQSMLLYEYELEEKQSTTTLHTSLSMDVMSDTRVTVSSAVVHVKHHLLGPVSHTTARFRKRLNGEVTTLLQQVPILPTVSFTSGVISASLVENDGRRKTTDANVYVVLQRPYVSYGSDVRRGSYQVHRVQTVDVRRRRQSERDLLKQKITARVADRACSLTLSLDGFIGFNFGEKFQVCWPSSLEDGLSPYTIQIWYSADVDTAAFDRSALCCVGSGERAWHRSSSSSTRLAAARSAVGCCYIVNFVAVDVVFLLYTASLTSPVSFA